MKTRRNYICRIQNTKPLIESKETIYRAPKLKDPPAQQCWTKDYFADNCPKKINIWIGIWNSSSCSIFTKFGPISLAFNSVNMPFLIWSKIGQYFWCLGFRFSFGEWLFYSWSQRRSWKIFSGLKILVIIIPLISIKMPKTSADLQCIYIYIYIYIYWSNDNW